MSTNWQESIPDVLISDLLRDDPDMYDLVEEFVEGLRNRIGEFRAAYEKLDWDQLTALAHQLKGAGGSYGYADLSQLGKTMEDAFRNHAGSDFTIWIQRFEQLIDAAKAGLPDPQA